MLKRHLLIITRRAPRTYEAMKQSFGGYAGIDVILDLRYRPAALEVVVQAGDRN
jgi:hypothetical protein